MADVLGARIRRVPKARLVRPNLRPPLGVRDRSLSTIQWLTLSFGALLSQAVVCGCQSQRPFHPDASDAVADLVPSDATAEIGEGRPADAGIDAERARPEDKANTPERDDGLRLPPTIWMRRDFLPPHITGPGHALLALDRTPSKLWLGRHVPADRFEDAAAAKYWIIDVGIKAEELVHFGRCPSGGKLAAFTVDSHRIIHLLCVVQPPRDKPERVDPTLGSMDVWPATLGFHGAVDPEGTVKWDPPIAFGGERISPSAEDPVVLAIVEDVPIVVYRRVVADVRPGRVNSKWYMALLREGAQEFTIAPPTELYAVGSALNVLTGDVREPGPEGTYDVYQLDGNGTFARSTTRFEAARATCTNAREFGEWSLDALWQLQGDTTLRLADSRYGRLELQDAYAPLGPRTIGATLQPSCPKPAEEAHLVLRTDAKHVRRIAHEHFSWTRATCAALRCLVLFEGTDKYEVNIVRVDLNR
jgi:hypothetical protein